MKLIRTRTILVPIDFSETSWRSFEIAVALATHLNLKIFLMHVLPSGDTPLLEIMKEESIVQNIEKYSRVLAKKMVKEAKKQISTSRYKGQKIEIETIIASGTPSRKILHEIRQRQPDLVVMGTHGLSELMSVILGGCAERVIRESLRPVLVVPRGVDPKLFKPQLLKNTHKPQQEEIFKIMLTTDFSQPSKHALSYAVDLCQLLPSKLYVLHVIEKFSFIDLASDEMKMEDIKEGKDEVIKFLNQDMSLARCPSVSITVRCGEPVKEILAITEAEDISVIVMGTLGKNWLERLLLGSTTEEILSRAKCPILTVRGAKKVDRIEKKFLKIKDSLSPYELQTQRKKKTERNGEEEQKTYLLCKQTPEQPTHLFLGYYSPEGLKNGIEQYGISRQLHGRGYEELLYSIDTRNPYHQIVRIFAGKDEDKNALLIEFALHEEVHNLREYTGLETHKTYLHFLAVDWVMLQNPFAQGFSPDRPRLPGQDRPGLGMGFEIFAILVMMTERLDKDGLISRPEHYHNAYLYHERCRFPDPEKEGLFLALTRDTASYSLPEVSWALEKGLVREATTGEVIEWTGEPLILPINKELQDYFSSEDYLQTVRDFLMTHNYLVDWESFEEIRDEILFPEIDGGL